MKARRPDFDFSETPAHWAATPEFAQHWNSNSIWIPHLERFLNRVVAKALGEIKGDDGETKRIKADARMFIRQEANHYSLHDAFNAAVKRDGYELEPFEAHFGEEFERLFRTKSLAFLCAYCEGFETFGPPGALFWLDEMEDLLEGARPEVVALWKWHLLEEYEHRTVCADVYQRIHGGYFLRIYALFYQLIHLQGFSAKVVAYLFAKDREGMSKGELKASKKRSRALSFRFARHILPRALKALSPFYSPRNAKEPRMYASYMALVESTLP